MTPPPIPPSAPSWDFSRFWQTLSFFDTIPLLSCLRKLMFGSTPPPPPPPQAGLLFDFRQPSSTLSQTWGALDDVVMGGVSASALQPREGAVVFTGYVSTANSGGFASVRTRNFEPPLDLSHAAGVMLRVKGDGQRYKFLIRDEAGWDRVAYATSFDTQAGEWITVQIPFTEMVPVFRARTVDNARPLNSQEIRSLQLMLSKFEYDGALNPHFQAGEFQLWVEQISVY